MKTTESRFWQFAVRGSRFAIRQLRAFTLVELLVVVAIIMLLAGIVLTAAKGAVTMANKRKAQTEVREIAKAITAYYAEYGKYPSCSGGYQLQWIDQIMYCLQGYDLLTGDPHTQCSNVGQGSANPRHITFLKMPTKSLCRYSGWACDYPLDPWDHFYNVIIDFNGDKQIDLSDQGSGSNSAGGSVATTCHDGNTTGTFQGSSITWPASAGVIKTGVAVWSNGPNGVNEWGAKDDVGSWQ